MSLQKAVRENNLVKVKQFLEEGILYQDDAFKIAISTQNVKCVRLFLEHGMNPNNQTREDGPSHFLYAFMVAPKFEIIKLLIDYKADIHVKSKDGVTPLQYALYEGKPEFIRLLLQKGIQVDVASSSGYNPLAAAIYDEKWECFELLLDAGAKICNSIDKPNATGLAILEKRRKIKQIALVFIGFGMRRVKRLNRDMAKLIGTAIWETRQNEDWLL